MLIFQIKNIQELTKQIFSCIMNIEQIKSRIFGKNDMKTNT